MSINRLINWYSVANNRLWICCPGYSSTMYVHCLAVNLHTYGTINIRWGEILVDSLSPKIGWEIFGKQQLFDVLHDV